jgi:hypothetical protein
MPKAREIQIQTAEDGWKALSAAIVLEALKQVKSVYYHPLVRLDALLFLMSNDLRIYLDELGFSPNIVEDSDILSNLRLDNIKTKKGIKTGRKPQYYAERTCTDG